jgi:tRNA (guanine-N7-)-methyltransferase
MLYPFVNTETGVAESAAGIKSFVIRGGRGTTAQRRSYGSLAGKFILPFEGGHADGTINFAKIFNNDNPVIVEIGFGMGLATAIIAGENPHKNYIGIEVHRPGIGRLLWEIEQRSLFNLRIIEHDAVEVLQKTIPLRSLEGIHLFFPDPWPKKRHHKRRLVKRPFTDTLAERLKPGGYLYMVTDWEDYAAWALAELGATEGLSNSCDGFAPPQPWRPHTSFEKKGLAKKHKVSELFFKASV